MGWAIKRSDGTYRGWNRNAQDDPLLAGETWEEMDSAPVITMPPRQLTEREKATADLKAMDPRIVNPEDLRTVLEKLQKAL